MALKIESMLNVTKEENSKPQKITLSGVIDETTKLDVLFGSVEKSLHIYCRDVSRINSNGIMGWVNYFSKFRQNRGTLKFFEVSPTLISALNCLSNFIVVEEVASLCVPFHCSKCNGTTLKIYTPKELKRLLPQIPTVPCDTCKEKAIIDENPEEYFSFLGT